MPPSNLISPGDVLMLVGVNPRAFMLQAQKAIETASWGMMTPEARVYCVLQLFAEVLRERAEICRAEQMAAYEESQGEGVA